MSFRNKPLPGSFHRDTSNIHTMQRRLTILAAALALPAAAVIFWMLAPDPSADTEATPAHSVPERGARTTTSATTSQSARTTVRTSADGSKMARRTDDDFPELTSASSTASELPIVPHPSISPRYTLTTQPDAAALARRLEGQPPLARGERIRILPSSATTDASGTSEQDAATANRAVLLRLDASLHDPAAWVEREKPVGEKEAAVQTQIGADFAAEVTAAAKQPETAGNSFDNTWNDARRTANWEYQKFFGAAAANRAALSAGKAAVSHK